MSKSKPAFKAKMIYGLVVTIPIAVLIIILIKLVEVLDKIAKATGLHSAFGAGLAVILALLLLLIVCYVIGSLVQTQILSLTFDKLEKKVLKQLPGYKIISNIIKGFTEGQIEAYQPAMIQLDQPGVKVLGFVMEENDNDTITVFVPSVPAPTIGGLYIVERDRVTFLESSRLDVINCITEWGVGSNKFIGKTLM